MKINPISINNHNKQNLPKTHQKTAFGSYIKHDMVDKFVVDSSFFRGNDILVAVINALEERFPKGAEIMDFACSNGEEAISILAQLRDKTKFAIRGFDVCEEALESARRGVHSVFSDGAQDAFLITGAKSDETDAMRNAFFSVMGRTSEPNEANRFSPAYKLILQRFRNFREEYFRLKPEVSSAISYENRDIRALDATPADRPVGAILFRNAFSDLCGQDMRWAMSGERHSWEQSIDAQAVADDLVGKIDARLERGGVFAIGESPKDNLCFANEFTPKENTMRFEESGFYFPISERIKDMLIMRQTPLVRAFEKNGKFRPIHFSDIKFLTQSQSCPTVWQKIE